MSANAALSWTCVESPSAISFETVPVLLFFQPSIILCFHLLPSSVPRTRVCFYIFSDLLVIVIEQQQHVEQLKQISIRGNWYCYGIRSSIIRSYYTITISLIRYCYSKIRSLARSCSLVKKIVPKVAQYSEMDLFLSFLVCEIWSLLYSTFVVNWSRNLTN